MARHSGCALGCGSGERQAGHSPADAVAVCSHARASDSSVKYLHGHSGSGRPRRPWAMTRSTGVLPRTAKALTVTASLKTRTASRLTYSTPVTWSRTTQPVPPVRVKSCSRAEVPSAPVIRLPGWSVIRRNPSPSTSREKLAGPASEVCCPRLSSAGGYWLSSVQLSVVIESPERRSTLPRRTPLTPGWPRGCVAKNTRGGFSGP